VSSGLSHPGLPASTPALRARSPARSRSGSGLPAGAELPAGAGLSAGTELSAGAHATSAPAIVRFLSGGLALALVCGLGACLPLLAGARPSYDAMGWMVWGHQVLHWNLNTDGAPSWKPLTFLFTLPYALAGHRGQLWLWTLTAGAGTIAACLLAGRIAHLLTPADAGRGWARWTAAAIAAVGVLAMNDYLHQALIANSDPLVIALLLGAIERHLAARARAAYVLIWLAGLDRPEVWVFLGLYGAWCWWARPRLRAFVLVGVALTPLCWFLVPALTSHSWLTPARFAVHSSRAIHGSKLIGVINRLRGLFAVPAQLALAGAIALALLMRRRALLGLLALILLWAAIEFGFALHGFSAAGRYLLEPGAVAVVLIAAAAGQLLVARPARPLAAGARAAWRLLGPLIVLALLGALAPSAVEALSAERAAIARQLRDTRQLDRLSAIVAADGGARMIRGCGQPVTLVGFQSALAWELDMNVGAVGFRPGRAIDSGRPIVFFKPHDYGWIVHADHQSGAARARCRRLDRRSAFVA
jgi:hypothetical protein